MAVDLSILKFVALGAIFVVALCFVYLPVYIFKKSGTGRWLDISNGFTAGVFMGAGMLHMLAESVEALEEFKDILGGEYPTPYLFAACGYIFILFLENVVVVGQVDEVCHVEVRPPPRRQSSMVQGQGQNASISGNMVSVNSTGEDSIAIPPDAHADHAGGEKEAEKEVEDEDEGDVEKGEHSHEHRHVHPHEHHHHHRHRHPSVIDSGPEGNKLMPYLVAIVLSLHSFLAGLALGSSLSFATALIVAIAIIAHKWSEAFALGVSFVRGNIGSRNLSIMTAIYVVMTPLGIGVGMAAIAYVSAPIAGLLSGIFSSVAGGTFIYIAGTELIPQVFEHPSDKVWKFGMFVVGFAIMAVVKLWV